MEETKKKKVGWKIFLVLALLAAAAMAAMPFYLEARQKEDGSKASILSAKAEKGTIRKTLSGTGTLTEQDAQEVTVPSGVSLTEFLVENGQIVQEGDPVAAVNRTSVMETISSVEEAMEETAQELEKARSSAASFTVAAAAAGRVKAVYASAGDDVQTVLLRHGALAVLSLDGSMAVRLPAQSTLSVGQEVTVILSGGTEAPGRVDSFEDGQWVVTISDSYGSIGEQVRIRTENGMEIGNGQLYVHSAWNAFCQGGTVTSVDVYEGQSVWGQSTLFMVDQSAESGSYEELLTVYRDYEKTMEELFRIYQSGVVTSPCAGCVSGVDQETLKLLSASGGEPKLMLVKNAPPDNADESYRNRIGIVTALGGDGTNTVVTARMQTWDTELLDDDYQDTSYLYTSPDSMTGVYEFELSGGLPVYRYNGAEWESVERVQEGDVFLFAYDQKGLVWLVLVGHEEEEKPIVTPAPAISSPTPTPAQRPDGGTGGTGGTAGTGGTQGTDGRAGGTFGGTGQQSAGGFSAGGGMTGGGTSYASSSSSQSAARETVSDIAILRVTPQEEVTVTITIDELDILSVRKGQDVTVTLDALTGRSFPGVITKVDTSPVNEGGNTKYSATVVLDREGLMLGGMNASVNIVVEERENVLQIPSEALAEENGRSIVYTGYDEKTGTLTGPVPVETGLSDGLKVQILSGLQEGDTVWYSYYDKLEIAGLPG